MPQKRKPPQKKKKITATTPKKQAVKVRPARLKAFLYGLIVVVGLVGGISYLPDSLLEEAPSEARQAVDIATEVRQWVVSAAGEHGTSLGEQLAALWQDFDGLSGGGDTDYTPVPTGELPRTATSWHLTRRALYEQVHYDRQETLYCGCNYNTDNEVDLASCGMGKLIGNARAERIEAEHVFPASQFGSFRQCWREPGSFPECTTSGGRQLSGRDCCQRVDPSFVAAHNDLHNLYPSVGYINGRRSNYNWGMIQGGDTYGDCQIRIDASIRRAQPPQHAKGFIARAMLYMQDTYGFRLSRQDQQLYRAWNNQYPPDDWEIERNRRITAIQGLSNRYIEEYRRL
ncbi:MULTISPECIES: endonuclease [unclassified Ectothiorhodospira]|uniref:endonuclease n=1 Tax=unclassified Ectothiorhodospira TaxID=2684909 RepID=UPI001EE82C02|nr:MULTISPECIES: endonuclease [unclassified Ectothiorhodospira]MCG5517377.1 endonuclease [Ectothiorhodospira sp. 9100]MCG5520267.1 endonuclease [Ectothiorhodospira sp. 9905]